MAAECQYCGEPYRRRGDDDYGALVRHLTRECREVPAIVRELYDRGCAYGNCGL